MLGLATQEGAVAQGRSLRTPEKGERLLAKLAQGYSVSAACKAEGIGRTAYYDWVKADPVFAQATTEAIERGTDVLEDVARTRAVKQSDTLLIFLLKARRPEKFKENVNVKHSGTIAHRDMSAFSDDEIESLAAIAERVKQGAN